jgi:hypothetical protein
MKHFTYDRLRDLLDDEESKNSISNNSQDDGEKVQMEALMIYRNLLCSGEAEIQQVLDHSGEDFLRKIADKIGSKNEMIAMHSIYVVSCIASGNQTQKKIALEDRFLKRAIARMEETDSSKIKIAVLNLIMNLAFKEGETEGRARKMMIEMKINEKIREMKERERDIEVKSYIDRALKSLD